MLPSSIVTFWSLTHQPSTPRKVSVAQSTAVLMASSKLLSGTALISVTEATVMACTVLSCWLPQRAPYPSSQERKRPLLVGGGHLGQETTRSGTSLSGWPSSRDAAKPGDREGGSALTTAACPPSPRTVRDGRSRSKGTATRRTRRKSARTGWTRLPEPASRIYGRRSGYNP